MPLIESLWLAEVNSPAALVATPFQEHGIQTPRMAILPPLGNLQKPTPVREQGTLDSGSMKNSVVALPCPGRGPRFPIARNCGG